MKHAARLLESYRSVVELAEAMLVQAQQGRWGEVATTARTVGRMSSAIDDIRRSAGELAPNDEAERVRMLARLIGIDARIRQLRQPWAQRLDALFAPQQGLGTSGHRAAVRRRTQPLRNAR